MRLTWFFVILALAVPATIFAQKADPPPRWTISPRNGPASEGWPRDPLPRFSIPPRGSVGLPLPQIGLSVPQQGLPPDGLHLRGQGRHHRRGVFTPWPAVVYFVPQYYAPLPEPEPIRVPVVEQPPPTGRLILDPQPESAQVFVDGYLRWHSRRLRRCTRRRRPRSRAASHRRECAWL